MTTDRAHAAEEEYFRNQEAERRREDAWQLQKTARAEQAQREALEARHLRQAARSADAIKNAPSWGQLQERLSEPIRSLYRKLTARTRRQLDGGSDEHRPKLARAADVPGAGSKATAKPASP